jgi:hypothetical protein
MTVDTPMGTFEQCMSTLSTSDNPLAQQVYEIYLTLTIFFIPLCILLIAYALILRAVDKRQTSTVAKHKHKPSQGNYLLAIAQEKKKTSAQSLAEDDEGLR